MYDRLRFFAIFDIKLRPTKPIEKFGVYYFRSWIFCIKKTMCNCVCC